MAIISAALVVAMVIIAVITDVREGKIYNALTIPCVAIGVGLNVAYGGWGGGANSLLGLAVGLGVFLVSSIFGRILGGGDIKLLMAIGAIRGPVFLLWTIAYMAIIGGILAVIITLWRRDFMASMRRLLGGIYMRIFAKVPIDVSDATPSAKLAYAIPIALGSVVALYASEFLRLY